MNAVAVLIAVYNGEKYLEELMDSIMSQTFQDFVCYVHDDGSSDHSPELLVELKMKYPEKVIILNYPPTGGSKENFMSLLKERTEPYIMFADQDDVWLPEKIEKSLMQMKQIEDYGSVPSLVFSDLTVVDQNLETIAPSFLKYMGLYPDRLKYQQLMMSNVASGCAMMINQQLAQLCTRIIELDNIPMHDWWFIVVAAIYGRISFIDESTILYRQHENNVLGARPKSKRFVDKVKANVDAVRTHDFIESKHKWILRCVGFAKELVKYNDLPPSVEKTLNGLINVQTMPHIYRALFYLTHGFLKKRRNLWMLLWV